MRHVCMTLIGLMALLAAHPAGAVCMLLINVDRTGSMLEPRADGMTRCVESQEQVLAILDAYSRGFDFDITHPELGDVTRPEYEANCPGGPNPASTAHTRLVMVREFHGDTMEPVGTPSFLPVNTVIPKITALDWYNARGRSLGKCPGASTPLAQGMCRAARSFPASAPRPGDFRIVKTTTDGQENSSDIVPLRPSEIRCRNPGESDLSWRSRVMDEFTSRGITTDAVLWGLSESISRQGQPEEARERVAEAYEYAPNKKVFAGPEESPDYLFFWSMALTTGGLFNFVDESTVLSPFVTNKDSDADGIPDFRDQCVGTCASDSDNDGILNAIDLCPSLAEDGRIPNRMDGCPDSDSDGEHNGVDQCPQALEDGLQPFPNDSCPAARWSAAGTPHLATISNRTVCTNLQVVSGTGAASLARLYVRGSHPDGRMLSGTLAHNGTTVTAFSRGRFSTASSGFFEADLGQIGMSPGAAAGTWTLCITDGIAPGQTANTFTGYLEQWAING